MSLKTVVKAGSITNLSDARYCAGMGVEIVGFPVGQSNPLALDPSRIKEIAGWLSGVKVALELNEADFDEAGLRALLESIPPDYLQVPHPIVGQVREITSLPLLIVAETLIPEVPEGDYVVYTGTLRGEPLVSYCKLNNVILAGGEINADNILDLLEQVKPYGIELKGGTEISPGLKDFDELSEILELLEVEE